MTQPPPPWGNPTQPAGEVPNLSAYPPPPPSLSFPPPPPPPPPAPVPAPSNTGPAFWDTLNIVIFSVSGLFTLLILLAALLSGATGIASLLASAASLAGVGAAFHYLDRFEPEPWSVRLWALAWGGTVSISGALLLELLAGSILSGAGHTSFFGSDISASVVAPLVEEGLKGLGVIIVARRLCITRPLNAVIYAGIIAAGFAAIENLAYYLAAVESGESELLFVIVARGVVSPFAHPLFTSFTAVGVALSIKRRSQGPLMLGLCGAVLSHGAWNFLAGGVESVRDGIVAYALVMMPLFLGMVVWVVSQHRAEERELKAAAQLVSLELSGADPSVLWSLKSRRNWRNTVVRQGHSGRAYDRWVSASARLALHRLHNPTDGVQDVKLSAAVFQNRQHLEIRSVVGK